MGVDGAIILDILNLIGRFFKFGMETKQFPIKRYFKWTSTRYSGVDVNLLAEPNAGGTVSTDFLCETDISLALG